ncbi:hypothetical protein WJX74_007710 [Apatococcus lobatus]|uniref:Uncharacterized protein n=1 Tax=Apatococcus lobatus TaxID=904363 RepID=A0AAW1RDE3_9CHLO
MWGLHDERHGRHTVGLSSSRSVAVAVAARLKAALIPPTILWHGSMLILVDMSDLAQATPTTSHDLVQGFWGRCISYMRIRI